MNVQCRSFKHPNEPVVMVRLPTLTTPDGKRVARWQCPRCGQTRQQTLRSARQPNPTEP